MIKIVKRRETNLLESFAKGLGNFSNRLGKWR